MSSAGIPSSPSTAIAASRIGKSERLPPTTPTRGPSSRSLIIVGLLDVAARPPIAARPAPRRRTERARASSTVGGERGQVAHLASFEHLALVVQVEMDRRDRRARPTAPSSRAGRRGPSAEQVDHRRRGERVRREPRPSPQIARMCCSNWDVAAPSIVQCPLLWTRGASSLTRSEPSPSRNSSAVSVPHRSIASARPDPIAVARSATLGATGAGRDASRPGSRASWTFRATGYGRTRPSSARATMIESSAVEMRARVRRGAARPATRPSLGPRVVERRSAS